MIELQRVLFVGAHCDDVELFAGGLLARCCLRGAEAVGVLAFSDHRGVVPREVAERARAEMRGNVTLLESRTGRSVVDHSEEMMSACSGELQTRRGEIYARLEALRARYDLVVTHDLGDTNQDHQQIAEEVRRVWKAHGTVLAGEFPSNDLGERALSVFVALTEEELDLKVAMVQAYESQCFGGRPYFDERALRGLAHVRGSQIREPAAEAFRVGARVVVR